MDKKCIQSIKVCLSKLGVFLLTVAPVGRYNALVESFTERCSRHCFGGQAACLAILSGRHSVARRWRGGGTAVCPVVLWLIPWIYSVQGAIPPCSGCLLYLIYKGTIPACSKLCFIPKFYVQRFSMFHWSCLSLSKKYCVACKNQRTCVSAATDGGCARVTTRKTTRALVPRGYGSWPIARNQRMKIKLISVL